jgi:hypothetical protein
MAGRYRFLLVCAAAAVLVACTFRAPRLRALTCRMRLPRRFESHGSRRLAIVVRAVLRRHGRVVAIRRANVR